MKLSINRRQMKGFFGGTYYESSIDVILTEEEEKAANKLGLMDEPIFYCKWSQQDERILLLMIPTIESKTILRFKQLVRGIVAKSQGEVDLGLLEFIEKRIREKYKGIEATIKNSISS
jgi:hypothetical protein